ncbi:glycosyltransferase family 2 protein [Cellulomonas endophytica]|uniref:glycosyltransferase family 2 protein n=1 Tax=Cellulomonas endophytica TaxID=2494735 RepID=UPI0013E8F6AD|nr:glycosyltransferase family A protein [Cellulomonas endophytica]
MSAAAEPLLVAIDVCTKLRPVGLAALLDSLAALEPASRPVRVAVVVVDNDPGASAREAVTARAAGYPHELLYVHEPVPGIPVARNAGIEASLEWARGHAPAGTEHPLHAVLVLDDDEVVVPGWLRVLLEVQESTGADVVTGTVEPVFVGTPPAWVVEGRFYERERFPTGTELNYARTSNVLVLGQVFTEDGLRFASVGMQGGSDTFFFERVHRLGRRIVWADEAVVSEEVPVSRISARWLVARHYRYGLVRSATLRALDGSPVRYVRRVGMGVLTVLGGVVRTLLGVRSTARRVAGAQQVARGAGLVLGLLGASYDDYRVVHGR